MLSRIVLNYKLYLWLNTTPKVIKELNLSRKLLKAMNKKLNQV